MHHSGEGGEENSEKTVNIAAHIRLAKRINAQLDWWSEDFKSFRVPAEQTAQIHLDWLHAKHLVNSVASKYIIASDPEEEAFGDASRVLAFDCALQLLQRCAVWSPPKDLTNLPHPYVRVSDSEMSVWHACAHHR